MRPILPARLKVPCGSLIEVSGVFYLFYTGHKLGSDSSQTICHATSSDLVHFQKVACRLRTGPKWRRGCIALATSPDLIRWSVEPSPLYAPVNTYCPECPELFELKGHWYLVYSRFSEDAATIYRMTDNPRGPWR